MTKREKAAIIREFTTDELRWELQKRERKSWQRQTLDGMLDTLSEKEIRAVLARLTSKPRRRLADKSCATCAVFAWR